MRVQRHRLASMVFPSQSPKNLEPLLSADQSAFDRHPLRRDDLTGSTYSVIAGGDVSEGSNIEFIIRRSGGLTSAGEVQLQVKSGSAKIDEDFTAADGYQKISFPALASNDVTYQEQKIVVPTISDDKIEIDESLIALLRPSSSVDRIQDSIAQAKILNDDEVARYSLSAVSNKVNEGEPFQLSVSRTSSKRPATIVLSLKGSGADVGADVVDIGKHSIAFEAGESSVPFTLNTTDDTAVEIPEGFFARIDSDSKSDQIDKGILYLEIKDNDVPSQYSLVKPEEVNEGGTVQFKVKRTGDTTTDGAFYFWTKNATAKSADLVGSDSLAKKQKITFPKGVTEHTVSVQTYQDYLVEDEEFFYGFIKPFNREDRVLKGSQKAVIVDNDKPVKYSLRVLKGSGAGAVEAKNFKENEQITFEITRSETGAPGSVRLKLRSATAREKVDFTPPTVETVEFTAGQSTKTVTVPIIDDTIVENKKEMFFASLRTNDRADVVNGSGKNQEITIEDNDTVMSYALSFIPLVDDGSGTLIDSTPIVGGDKATVEEGNIAKFRITRSGGDLSSAGEILFRTMAGSAKDPGDFAGEEKQVIKFDVNQTEREIRIPTVGDFLVERNETFSAVIRAKNKQDKISNRQQLVTIDDNDEPAAFSITAANPEVAEGQPLSVTITKTGGEGRTSSVLVSTANNRSSSSSSAKSGKDYEKNRLQLDFGPNDASTKTITIPTFDDQEVESAKETFFVNIKSLSSQDSHGYDKDASKDKSKVELTIADNDKPAVFSVTSSDKLDSGQLGIGESNPFSFTITKTGGEGRTSSVLVSTSNGSARSGSDYEKFTREKISFAPDDPSTKTISIPTLADEDIEGGSGLGEDFYVDVNTVDAADSIEGSSDGKKRLDVTIVDDDKPAQFSLSADKSSVNEGELITFTVARTGGENRTSSVVLSTSNGSAKWGRDYERKQVRLDFLPDDSSTKTFTISTVDDQLIENKPSTEEKFYVDIQALDSADSITGNKQLELTITDNDQPAQFSVVAAAENLKNQNDPDEITVNETGTISFTVNRTGGGGRTTGVLVTTKNGSAKAGSDYVGQKKEYIFGPNDTASKTLTIPINSDERIEGGAGVGENFSIHVKPLDSADTVSKSKLDVTIVDDDEPAVFSVSADKTEVEEGGSIGFTISKSGGQGRTSSVVVSTSNGSAKWGRDYERLVPTQIDFAAGETSKPISVKTLTDELNEKVDNTNENFYFVVKPLNSADSITDGDARLALTIADPVVGGSSQIV